MKSLHQIFRIIFAGFLIGSILGIINTLSALNYYPSSAPAGGGYSIFGSHFSRFSNILVSTADTTDGKVKNTDLLGNRDEPAYQWRIRVCPPTRPIKGILHDGSVDCSESLFSWSTGGYGACVPSNGVCGAGVSTRPVTCIDEDGQATADESKCEGVRPGATQTCSVSCGCVAGSRTINGRSYSYPALSNGQSSTQTQTVNIANGTITYRVVFSCNSTVVSNGPETQLQSCSTGYAWDSVSRTCRLIPGCGSANNTTVTTLPTGIAACSAGTQIVIDGLALDGVYNWSCDILTCSATKAPPVPSCTDGVQNGLETGVDCGGTCPACAINACGIEISAGGGPTELFISGDAAFEEFRAHYSNPYMRWIAGEAPGSRRMKYAAFEGEWGTFVTTPTYTTTRPANIPGCSFVPPGPQAANPPGAPMGLSAIAGNASVSLSWTPSTGGPTDYIIEFKMSSSSSWGVFPDGVSLNTTTNVTGLTNGISYDFRVKARNANGDSGYTGPVSATPVGVAPPPPPNASCTTPWGSTVAHGASILAYQSATVPNGSSCVSETRSCNNGNLSGTYGASGCTVLPPVGTPPPTPMGLSGTPGNASASLSWSASAGANRYILQYTPSGNSSWSSVTTTSTTMTVTGLANGILYSFRVIASNNFGDSAPSNTISLMPVAPCNTPWGTSLAHGASVTAYSVSTSPNCSGVSEVRTCTNGVLSGTYGYPTCSPPACTSVPSALQGGSCATLALQGLNPTGRNIGIAYYRTETAACTGNAGQIIPATVDLSSCISYTYSWIQTGWGSCSATCGGGTMPALYACQRSDGTIVSDGECPTAKPTGSQPCNTQACATSGPYSYGAWGACSVSCGGGTQTRTESCNFTSCTNQQPTSQSCNTQACAPTTCSSPCGVLLPGQTCDAGDGAAFGSCIPGQSAQDQGKFLQYCKPTAGAPTLTMCALACNTNSGRDYWNTLSRLWSTVYEHCPQLATFSPPTPVNGSCGSSTLTCTSGTPREGNGSTTCGTTRTWSCDGVNGGSSASCSSPNAACAVNGSCGGSPNTCASGTPSGYSAGSCGGSATWSCNGANGGGSASCSSPNAACPPSGRSCTYYQNTWWGEQVDRFGIWKGCAKYCTGSFPGLPVGSPDVYDPITIPHLGQIVIYAEATGYNGELVVDCNNGFTTINPATFCNPAECGSPAN